MSFSFSFHSCFGQDVFISKHPKKTKTKKIGKLEPEKEFPGVEGSIADCVICGLDFVISYNLYPETDAFSLVLAIIFVKSLSLRCVPVYTIFRVFVWCFACQYRRRSLSCRNTH